MEIPAIAAALSVPIDKAVDIYYSIHHKCSSLLIKGKFNDLLGRLHLACTDYLSNISGDTNRFNALEIWSKNTGEPAPICFEGLSSSDDEALAMLLEILTLVPEISPAFASSVSFLLVGVDIVVQGVVFNTKTFATLAKEMADLGYILTEDAEFLGRHAALIPPTAAIELKVGDAVAFLNSNRPQKSMKYRCSNMRLKHPWPPNHRNQLGRISYVYSSDYIFDIAFENGRTYTIHGSHIIRIVASHHREGTRLGDA
jgi:hypothetical protein